MSTWQTINSPVFGTSGLERFVELGSQLIVTISVPCITKFPSLGQSSREKYPYFCRYLNFITTQCVCVCVCVRVHVCVCMCSVGYVEESFHTKISSICPAVSIEHRLVTDGQTNRQTDTRPYCTMSHYHSVACMGKHLA